MTMRNVQKSWRSGILVGLLLLTYLIEPIQAEDISGVQLAIIESSQRAIVVELTTGSYEVEQFTDAGEIFDRILLEGTVQTSKPGMPQTPTRGIILGIPTIENVTLDIVTADYDTLSDYRLSPAPLPVASDNVSALFANEAVLENPVEDADSYKTDVYYPTISAELGQVGYIRDQAVAQIQFYPVQFNPIRNEVRLYRRIVVRISWRGDVHAAGVDMRYRSPDYESLLSSTLLNYVELRRPVINPDLHPNFDNETNVPSNISASTFTEVPMLKISINETGLYRITYTDLVSSGFNPSTVDPRLLHMSNGGEEIAIDVYGQEDAIFHESDYILFYGIGLNDVYTNQNIYWLSVGNSMGRRMALHDISPVGTAPALTRFPAMVHGEEDTNYWQSMPDQGDRWFWETRLSPNAEGLPNSRIYPLQVGVLSAGDASAIARVRLKGVTKTQHRTQIRVNGRVVDEQTWHGQIEYTHQINIAQSLLQTGINEITVKTIDIGAAIDQIYVNWIELDYWGALTTNADELSFRVQEGGLQTIAIHGFHNNDIYTLDVTDPTAPIRILGALINKDSGGYSATFADNIQPSTRYLVFTSSKFRPPTSIVIDSPSAWKSPLNQADYIIITHESFYDSALMLAQHRSNAGFSVATVAIQDLYDEFNDGIFNPVAIRDFLSYAYQTWRAPAPAHVVLIGDANQDYKDNLRNGTINYVPSQNIIVDGSGEMSSDNWFVTINGNDNLPDIFIGRLVAQSHEEINRIIEKIIAYDHNPPDSTWNKNVSLIASDEEPMFLDLSEQIATRLPYYYQINRININNISSANAKANIVNQINNGAVFVNYAGHGWYFGWGRLDNGVFFGNADVDALSNTNKYPIITIANCLNGFFAGPKDKPALAEVLLRRPNAGAVAVWAPSSFGDVVGHRELLKNFYEAIFLKDQITLGAATTAAKFATFAYSPSFRDLIDTYVLFGDPAMKVGISANFPYLHNTSPASSEVGISLDQSIRLSFNKPVDPNTVTILETSLGNLNFVPSWNADFTVANFSHSNFEHNKTYTVLVGGQDRLDNGIGPGVVPNPWSFTVTTDNLVPSGKIVIQGNDLSSVLATARINIEFTEPVRTDSITYGVHPPVKGSLIWDESGQRATFRHDSFTEERTYEFTILTAVDIPGNALNEPFQATFRVGKTLYLYLPSIFN